MPTKRALERTQYTVRAAQLPANATQVFFVAQNVDVSQYLNCQVLFRIHSFLQVGGNQATSQGKLQIDCFRSAPTEEDPSTTFREGTLISGLSANYTWANAPVLNPNTGILVATSNVTGVGECIDIQLTVTPSSPAVDLIFSISIDVVTKP